jgi:hypothetical protein
LGKGGEAQKLKKGGKGKNLLHNQLNIVYENRRN